MAFKASFKFSDSREFDVLRWDVKFNRDVDPKGRPASDIYGGKIYVEVESTPDTIVLDKMFKQYQPVNGSIVFKKADEDGLSGNFWLVSFKISYLCLPLFYETRTTPSCHPSGCAYRQL